MNAAGVALRPAPDAAPARPPRRDGVQVIESRPGVRQLLLVTSVEGARQVGDVVVMLGSGGGGFEVNQDDGAMRVQGGFQPGQQQRLAEAIGGAVVALSPPSDRPVMDLDWRLSSTHVDDLRAAVAWSRERWPGAAVWMLGFEAGALSAAVATASIGETAGSILIRPPEEACAQQPASDDMRTLVIRHGSGDAAAVPQGVGPGRRGRRSWLRVEDDRQARTASPGDEAAPDGRPFGGKQDQVVEAVARWIATGAAPLAIR